MSSIWKDRSVKQIIYVTICQEQPKERAGRVGSVAFK